ncbi:MAG: DUF421 domain-containing protein [Clostridia bacterium]|nr:DUF421 domain-containing protein [Clostridia bacterium]
MGLIIIRTIIVFLTLLIIMRLMGKRQIGEMQPYEFVITLIIAEIACIPMSDSSIPLSYGITAILTIYFLHQVVCLIDLSIPKAKTLFAGTPSVVINQNGIDATQLKKNNLDVSDLIESMRGAGYFALDDVEYALYESNGKFSALAKAKDSAGEKEENPSLPVLLVCEGKFNDKNLRLIGKEKGYFLEKLRGQGFNELKKVLVMTVDGAGKVYAQESGQSYRVFSLGWQERLW